MKMKMNEKEIKLVISLILINLYLMKAIHFLSNELSLKMNIKVMVIT